jgi:hypothetical protein
MLPALFPLIRTATAVTTLIGTSPVRCFRHGSAPQGTALPYVTWYVVSGVPENDLSDLPKVDSYSVQVDCWSADPQQVEDLADAVRDALEPAAYMTAIAANGRDPVTMNFRLGMTFNFWTPRPAPSS